MQICQVAEWIAKILDSFFRFCYILLSKAILKGIDSHFPTINEYYLPLARIICI